VQFLENAMRGGQPPDQVATTARSLIPGEVLGYIQHVGVDGFLDQVARLEPGSTLSYQQGRTYCREVAKFLLGPA
jgi:hypothetical protein